MATPTAKATDEAGGRAAASAAVRTAVAGYGWWGSTITRLLAGSASLSVVSVVEPDPQVREKAAADAPSLGFRVLPDLDALLREPDVEAVILCTPHEQHARQIVAAAQAGLHVFCEKPLCLTADEARLAVGTCQRLGRVLGVGHERRFEPAVQALRRRLAAGELGTVLQIEGNFSQDKFFALPKDNWRLSNAHAPVGPLTATGIHIVDLAIAVLGPCESVWARLSRRGSDFENGDTLAIALAFPGGANALVSAMLATPFEGRFAVYGSQGWMEIRDRTHPENPTGWDVTTALRGRGRTTEFWPPAASVASNLEAFARAVRSEADYPVAPGEMLANVATLEAIMRSVRSGRIEPVSDVSGT